MWWKNTGDYNSALKQIQEFDEKELDNIIVNLIDKYYFADDIKYGHLEYLIDKLIILNTKFRYQKTSEDILLGIDAISWLNGNDFWYFM
jgi:hypothetical protein